MTLFKRYLCLFFVMVLIVVTHRSFAQQTANISGTGYKEGGYVEILGNLKNPIANVFESIAKGKVLANKKFNFELPIKSAGSFFVRFNGTSHEVFLRPGDSLIVNFSILEKADTLKAMNVTRIRNEKVSYLGSLSSRFAFFDALEDATGDLSNPPFNIDLQDEDFLKIFKKKLDSCFNLRIQYANSYIEKNALDLEFAEFIKKEIRLMYLNTLLKAIFYVDKSKPYPIDYFSEIENENYTYAKCISSRYFLTLAHGYLNYFGRTKFGGEPEEKLSEIFNSTLKCIKDIKLRDYFLVNLLAMNFDKKPSNFEEYYLKFLEISKNPKYKEELDILINPKMVSNQVMNERLINYKGEEIQFSEIISETHRLKLIDCWASWCKPCLLEMPYSKIMEKKFKNKVDFIYISVDKDSIAWKNMAERKSIVNNQYRFVESGITQFFNLKSIPRYILMDYKGRIINSFMPNPSEKKEFALKLDTEYKKVQLKSFY